MIWIQSCDDDMPTFAVIDWLHYYGKEWYRSNNEHIYFESLNISDDNLDFVIRTKDVAKKTRCISYKDITSYWYRRGYLIFDLQANISNENEYFITDYLKREVDNIKENIYALLNDKRHINSFSDNSINKLNVLLMAKKAGLLIPNTSIITEESKLNEILNQQDQISKSISVSGIFGSKNYWWATSFIDRSIFKDVRKSPDGSLFPSLVQQHIKKRFEIRTFYVHGQFYSSVILSQNDEKTKIDFRNYNVERPNRTPRFELPEYVKAALVKLFHALELNSGSVDLIYGTDKKFYFLEVNPVGQFSQVSYPCNYFIERSIAKYLSHE